jgi:hypothetical protein
MGRGGELAEVTSVTPGLSGVTPGTTQHHGNTSQATRPRFALGVSARTTGIVATSSHPEIQCEQTDDHICSHKFAPRQC